MLEKVVLAAPYKMLATNVLFYRPEPFASQDLDIEVIYTGSGEPVVQALLNGDAGFTHVCGAPLPAAVAGRGLKVLAAFQFSSFELYAHPDIKSLSHEYRGAGRAGGQPRRGVPEHAELGEG